MKRNTRIVVLVALLLAMPLAFTDIANVTGSSVWLMLLLTGMANDVSSGPIWTNWVPYIPAVMFYTGVIVVGVLWVRAAPHSD